MAASPSLHPSGSTPGAAALDLEVLSDLGAAARRLDQIADRTNSGQAEAAIKTVDSILAQVRSEGDQALLELSERFDGVRPDPLRIPIEQLQAAWDQCDNSLKSALELAHDRILAFHQRQLPSDLALVGPPGERLGRRWRPVETAGIYIPGGRASYPSTVLMNAVPARVAGVKRLVMVTPPGPDGQVNATVLAAAHLAGVDEIYRVGGAQAIGALAYGTATIPRVDVITGPGNLYVTLAKKAVYGRVAIDSLAGPSEVLVIADHSARADQVAADLLAQAEHDPLAAAIPTLEAAAALSDRFAPEHLELLVEQPEPLAERIQHAGAIFLGAWSPEAVGDYLAGPNHTLPTSGTARFASALGVETFLRHTSLIHFNRQALEATGPAVVTLAESEGLHSHAQSVRLRLEG